MKLISENDSIVIIDDMSLYNEDLHYSDVNYVDFVIYNGEDFIDGPYFVIHDDSDDTLLQRSKIDVKYDGWITVVRATLPKSGDYTCDYENIYYKNKIISKDDFLAEVLRNNSTINSESYEYVSIAFLELCYINKCLALLNNYDCGQCITDDFKYELYNLQLLDIFLNAISEMACDKQFEEIQELIDAINSCSGFCGKLSSTNVKCHCRG